MHVNIHVYVHIYTYMCVYLYIHIYIYTYIHTYSYRCMSRYDIHGVAGPRSPPGRTRAGSPSWRPSGNPSSLFEVKAIAKKGGGNR